MKNFISMLPSISPVLIIILIIICFCNLFGMGMSEDLHIGIYMGELTINGDTSEWVIDTGGNPTGVKIRKYNNGWWNGSHFYGFGRLKENK